MTRKKVFDGRYEIRLKQEQRANLNPEVIRWVSEHTGIVSFLRDSLTVVGAEGQLDIELMINGQKFNHKG